MKNLESIVNNYRKRIELHLTGTSSTGISMVIQVHVHLKDHPELLQSFEKWLNDYYDFLKFADIIPDYVGNDLWHYITR